MFFDSHYSLISFKEKLSFLKDVLMTIAYGTDHARFHAAHLLFFYWPNISVLKSDKPNTYCSFNRESHLKPSFIFTYLFYLARKPIYCQSERCFDKKSISNKVITDASFIMNISNNAPPLYLCNDCFREVPKFYQIFAKEIMPPIDEVSAYCQNKVGFRKIRKEN
jgi:hypothetical protein